MPTKRKPKREPIGYDKVVAMGPDPKKDLDSERFAFLSKQVADAKLLAALALLAALMGVLLILTVVTPMNDRLDIIGAQTNSIAVVQAYQGSVLYNKIDNSSSFCLGYGPNGQTGAFIDDRKLPLCTGVNISKVG